MGDSAALNPSGRNITEMKTAISRIGHNNVRTAAVSFAIAQLRRANELRQIATIAAPFVDVSKVLAQPVVKTPALAWTQWGGPNRNFHTEARGLKDTWPATGPRVPRIILGKNPWT